MFTPRGSAEDCAVPWPRPRPLCHTDWHWSPAPCVTLSGTAPPPPVSQLSHLGHRILEINTSRHPPTQCAAAASSISTSPPVKG